MSININPKPGKPIASLITVIVTSVLFGIVLYFFIGTVEYKAASIIVVPIIIAYAVYSYLHEKKDDNKSDNLQTQFIDGTYFNTTEWQMRYNEYRTNHPFEKPIGNSMRSHLLSKYRSRKTFVSVLLFAAFTVFSGVVMFFKFQLWQIAGVIVFGAFTVSFLSDFFGRPVRKFLKRDIDYPLLEHSYMNGKMLTYKENGIILGLTHIHIYTQNDVWAIDYRIVDEITRKILRVKNYQNSIYSGNDFKHYLVVHMRIPKSGSCTEIEVELNEYQVQMIIDELSFIKSALKNRSLNEYTENYNNDIVT